MRRTLAIAASLLALAALALIGATAAVAKNPNPTYTCTKPKQSGNPDVRVSVPEGAVSGLTNAGFTCVADSATDESQGDEQGQGDDQNQEGDDQNQEGDDQGQDEDARALLELSLPTVAVDEPSEPRAIYCSTKGPVGRGDGAGVALDLPVSQGALLVEQGLAAPGIFYEGVGVSCDVLPGFTYSGVWVDNVGDVVPGVAVYPYYVPAG
jgi:hypothetical protein